MDLPLLHDLNYYLRQNYLGKIAIRAGFPQIDLGGDETALNEKQFYTLLLQRAFPEGGKGWGDVWDVGCRNWSYVSALADFFPNASLLGVEVDGGRRYWDLYRRCDYAEAYARSVGRARCIFGDFRSVRVQRTEGVERLFCFFFPFVSSEPCLKWGLPQGFSDFSDLIVHALTTGADAGLMSVHQGEWEAEIARGVYRQVGVEMNEIILKPSEFETIWPATHDVHVFVDFHRCK